MSATGRGSERQKYDFYETPSWVVKAILPYLHVPESILDPCCGEGAILEQMRTSPERLRGIEIDPERAQVASQLCSVLQGDALKTPWPKVDLIITNPPYSLAMEFLEKSLASGAREVAFLLRLNFLGSKKRAKFHRKNPAEIYVLNPRPSFSGGGTDATEYAWFVWGKDRTNRWFILDRKE